MIPSIKFRITQDCLPLTVLSFFHHSKAKILTTPGRTFNGTGLNISGWGVISFNGTRRGPTSFVLKTTTAKGVDRNECDKTWDAFDNPGTVFRELPHLSEKQACVGNTPGAACFVSLASG